MKKANLIDMFGLSGDPSDEDRLEKLLHLASDELDTPAAGCSAACFVTHDHNNASEQGPANIACFSTGTMSQAHTQALHFIN